MLDLRFIRTHPEVVRQAIAKRRQEVAALDELLAADERRRALLVEVEALKAERNRVSAEVAKIKAQKGDASQLIAEMREVGDRIKTLDEQTKEAEAETERLALLIPNMPDESVPPGDTEEEDVMVRRVGRAAEDSTSRRRATGRSAPNSASLISKKP